MPISQTPASQSRGHDNRAQPAHAYAHGAAWPVERGGFAAARRDPFRTPLISWLWSDPRRWFVAVFTAIPVACAIDAKLPLSGGQQWLLAAIVWAILLGGMLELPRRRQLALVCFLPLITLAEIGLSHELGWYTYRLGHVPPWVPPAHGIVFLTALRAIDTARIPTRVLAWSAAGAQAAYCILNLLFRGDEVGALLGLVYLIGMLVLPDEGKRFYAMLGLVVAYLEIAGTALGTWTWAPTLFGISEANPPSGAVGGYSLLDGAAFLLAAGLMWLAPRIVAAARRRGELRVAPAGAEPTR